MSPAIETATLGLRAASWRLDASAHNLANANTGGFVPLRADGGTAAGPVSVPSELVGLAVAATTYDANARVVLAADAVAGTLLDLRA